jgi:hypothetical protein
MIKYGSHGMYPTLEYTQASVSGLGLPLEVLFRFRVNDLMLAEEDIVRLVLADVG